MMLFSINLPILLFCSQIKYNFGLEALEVNTDYADYKVLKENQELELSCKNNVDPLLAVTWTPPRYGPHEKYTVDVKDGNVFTLTIKNAKREYAGKYTCNSHTRNGDQITKDIHVGVPPKIVNIEQSTKGYYYSTLRCIDDKFTYPKSVYAWTKNDIKLEDEETPELRVNESGNYTCTLANSIGSATYSYSYYPMDDPLLKLIFGICCALIAVAFIILVVNLILNIRDGGFIKNINITIIAIFIIAILSTMATITIYKEHTGLMWLFIIEIMFSLIVAIYFAIDIYYIKYNKKSLFAVIFKRQKSNQRNSAKLRIYIGDRNNA